MEIFAAGHTRATQKAPAERFTGDVWVDMLAEPPDGPALRMGEVHFSPGARSHWHRHAHGQLLLITRGVARVGNREGAHEVRQGQRVWTPPGEWHWHGAGPDCFMSHLTVSESRGDQGSTPETDWGDAVTEPEYSDLR